MTLDRVLYRAIDSDGNLVDSRRSEKRDLDTAQQFFEQAVEVVGHAPEQITTGGHHSSPRAICETVGNDAIHWTNVYLNNRIEQDHRGIKHRYSPLCDFRNVASAARFCRAFDEVPHSFRPRHTARETVPLAQQRPDIS
jgi:putative transposase